MKLGILINTDNHLEDLHGLANAALSRGHELILFFMDDGVKLLHSEEVSKLSKTDGVKMSYCDYSLQRTSFSSEGISEKISAGSQFDNASMNHDSDRVIIL